MHDNKPYVLALESNSKTKAVSYTHLRAHETRHDLVCRLLLEKKEVLNKLQIQEKEILESIKDIELKNTLLSEKLDYDFIDMLIRDKLMLGKKGETTYIVVDNEG